LQLKHIRGKYTGVIVADQATQTTYGVINIVLAVIAEFYKPGVIVHRADLFPADTFIGVSHNSNIARVRYMVQEIVYNTMNPSDRIW
jgi:hypothetical protein